MEIKYFPTLPIGTNFVVDGEAFTKTSELVYRDAISIEHYIDPLFDVKLGKVLNPPVVPNEAEVAAAAAAKPPVSLVAGVNPIGNLAPIQLDAEGRIILTDAEVERIAQRVVQIMDKRAFQTDEGSSEL